jgi:hypothetical protein
MNQSIERRKVRLFQLDTDSRWKELGNGHVLWVSKRKPRSARIMVLSEIDGARILLLFFNIICSLCSPIFKAQFFLKKQCCIRIYMNVKMIVSS